MTTVHPELGCYLLAGQPDSSRDILDEARAAESLGLGTAFVSERYNRKEAIALAGAAVAVTDRITIATAATNHNTRHLMVTAGATRTLRDLSGGRFVLGLGRGIPVLQDLYGLSPITTGGLEDAAGLLRRLFRGEAIVGHDGPAASVPVLHLDSSLDEYLPLALVAFGPKTLTLGGRCFDEVVLHTYFTPETTQRAVRTVKDAAEKAGRDPAAVRVWSCLATVGDHVPEATRLRKTVGRLGTYLQGYGDLLVRTNGWDQAVLQRFLADPVVSSIPGLDIAATADQLEHAAGLLPEEWLQNAAVGTSEQCVDAIRGQLDLGCDAVILHGSTPTELAPIVETWKSPPTKHSLV
ncbi:TIGR03857 family LLM class F420-dependent oxidoreductase [Williamsia serinedens]|uniref:F420-dependent oxidoreductase, MSMEG_2249 family n=1 Tax=Williamsia serinedens TaxID=391736 RepID=A0ABT1H4V0_9NOCA|nr:TIGR03857 family LLM class F420-dependent oxidoreductase [Williamsia serinedens]MCP2162276.1 putative F420-dependent oxidoreductase, MSMEG_2249 family [Williamsia serinedens]